MAHLSLILKLLQHTDLVGAQVDALQVEQLRGLRVGEGEVAGPDLGQFSGDLLVGNFGDGRINAFDPQTGRMTGTLRGSNDRPLSIDGLWGLLVGDPAAGGPNAVWFSAGPAGETHGLLGILTAN